MTGWLIVNEFLQSNKFNEIHSWLIEAAKKQGIQLELKTNAELLIDLSCNTDTDSKKLNKTNPVMSLQPKMSSVLEISYKHKNNINNEINSNELKVDFILFWDKDVRLASYLEQLGYPVFNSSRAIRICDDKSLTHMTLSKFGIPMPRTMIAPMTFDNIGYTNLAFLDEVSNRLGYPMVVKECFGSFGQQVYLVNHSEELRNTIRKTGAKPILFQEYITSSFGKDIRLQVVGNQVIASMYRYSENGDFRANVTIGGKIKSYTPTIEQTELALECCRIIGLDFAGVDILFGKNDEPILCEINSNAHFKNIYDCTGVNAAQAIITHIKKKITNII